VPVGDTQRAFAVLAQRDGIDLAEQSVDWLNQRGHLGLPNDDKRRDTIAALETSIWLWAAVSQHFPQPRRPGCVVTSSTRGLAL
jgi:hypothetical protein